MKLDQIMKKIRIFLKRSEPLLMVKFPTPPGKPKPRGYDLEKIHPFMSQREVARAASAILFTMHEAGMGANDYSKTQPAHLSDEDGSMWDHSLDSSACYQDGPRMLRAVRKSAQDGDLLRHPLYDYDKARKELDARFLELAK